MGIFGRKQSPPLIAEFDGMAGAQDLERLVDWLLECAAQGRTDGVLDTAQQIFLATPRNPRAQVSADFLEEPWKWMMAVAHRAAQDGNRVFPAKIGLMCQLWNRVVLADEPRYQMGRLVQAPSDIELGLYRFALAALVTMGREDVLIPGGDRGWVAVEALEQISHTVRTLISQSTTVDPELRGLATGDPATVTAARVSAGSATESDSDRAMGRLREFNEMAGQAKQTGDVAGQIYARGVAVGVGGGNEREALRLFEEAARLGHVDAMYDAGCVANNLGDMSNARLWWEAAANAGHGNAAQNMAASEIQAGRLDEAHIWFLRAAELGNPAGFAALTQMARDAGDDAEEMRWARAGAEAGHPFCMVRYGLLTLKFHGDDLQAVRGALPYLERAGELGDPEAMFLAGIGHNGVGDRYEARQWLVRAEQAGYARAPGALNQFKLDEGESTYDHADFGLDLARASTGAEAGSRPTGDDAPTGAPLGSPDRVGNPIGRGSSGGDPPERVSSGGAIPDPRRRYLKCACPESIPVGRPFSLIASIVLTGSASAGLKPFGVPPEGRDVLLVIHAPGLWLLGDQRQTVHVPANSDSEPVMFELRADQPGVRTMSVTAWIGGSYLGEMRFDIMAERDQPAATYRDLLSEITTEPTQGPGKVVN